MGFFDLLRYRFQSFVEDGISPAVKHKILVICS